MIRHQLAVLVRTRAALAPAAAFLFVLLGVYAYRGSGVGSTYAFTALLLCPVMAWLVAVEAKESDVLLRQLAGAFAEIGRQLAADADMRAEINHGMVAVLKSFVAEQKSGPFGGKGVGERGTFGVSPAIANAIHVAVGVRLTELPLKAEAIFMALKK